LLLGFTILIPVSSSAAQSNRSRTDPPLLKKCWNYPAELDGQGFTADNTLIFLGEQNARIEAISVDTGGKFWASDLGGAVVSNIFAGDKNIYVATRSTNSDPSKRRTTLWALSKDTGLTVFSVALSAEGHITLGGFAQRIFGVSDGMIAAFDASTGTTLWRHPIADVSAGPVTSNGNLVVGLSDNNVLSISGGDGEIISRWETKYLPTAIASADAGTIVIGDERGNLMSFDTTGDTNWKLRQGAKISEIDVNGDSLLITSYDNFIYSVDAGSGKIEWKKRMAGRVNAVPDTARHIALTLSTSENTAFVIDTKNGKFLNQLTLDGENAFVREPVIAGDSAVFATVDGVVGYGIAGCTAK